MRADLGLGDASPGSPTGPSTPSLVMSTPTSVNHSADRTWVTAQRRVRKQEANRLFPAGSQPGLGAASVWGGAISSVKVG